MEGGNPHSSPETVEKLTDGQHPSVLLFNMHIDLFLEEDSLYTKKFFVKLIYKE